MPKTFRSPRFSGQALNLDLARVLLVHGELAPRLALRTILQAGGYAVDVAASTSEALAKLGFTVTPSQANFVWARRSDRPVKPMYEELKRRMILVRYMNYQEYGDGLRITVGTDAEVDRLLEELGRMLADQSGR